MRNVANLSELIQRIYLTKKNIGTKNVSFATNVEYHLLISPLDQKLKKYTVLIATMHHLQHAAMGVGKSSKQALRRWNIKDISGTINVFVVVFVRIPLAQKVSYPETTTSTAQVVMRRSLQLGVSNVIRLLQVVVLHTAMSHGTENVSAVQTAIHV